MQGAALGDKQAGRCNRRTGGGSSCPPRQEVLDRLSLLLCSRELLGQVTGCVAEEASLGYRNRLCRRPYVNQIQPEHLHRPHKPRRIRPDEYLQARKRRHGLPCQVETV